jgi:hypothetical protein
LQAIAATIGGGPWHYVKLQLAWVLFLLAAKSPANRSLIEHLMRTMVAPLAQQLANAEAFYASDEAFNALTVGCWIGSALLVTLAASLLYYLSLAQQLANAMVLYASDEAFNALTIGCWVVCLVG